VLKILFAGHLVSENYVPFKIIESYWRTYWGYKDNRRKFRSQTSDNMDKQRWKQRWEESEKRREQKRRREDQRREGVRRKKIRKKTESRETLAFFQ
jgi:hypothetical protein